MVTTILVVVLGGLVVGAWATLLWACSRGDSIIADILAVLLAAGAVVYAWSPAPTPVSLARDAGWVTTQGATLVVVAGVFAIAAVGFWVALRAGWVRLLTQCIDGRGAD